VMDFYNRRVEAEGRSRAGSPKAPVGVIDASRKCPEHSLACSRGKIAAN
jgi:hypothetical protein